MYDWSVGSPKLTLSCTLYVKLTKCGFTNGLHYWNNVWSCNEANCQIPRAFQGWLLVIFYHSSFPAFLISWAYAVYLATDIFVANYWFIIYCSEKCYFCCKLLVYNLLFWEMIRSFNICIFTAHLAYMILWYNSDWSFL